MLLHLEVRKVSPVQLTILVLVVHECGHITLTAFAWNTVSSTSSEGSSLQVSVQQAHVCDAVIVKKSEK